jgi:hypothetical protein
MKADSCAAREIFRHLDKLPAEGTKQTQEKLVCIEAHEILGAYSILRMASWICAALNRSMMHIAPRQRGQCAIGGLLEKLVGIQSSDQEKIQRLLFSSASFQFFKSQFVEHPVDIKTQAWILLIPFFNAVNVELH